ncbi:hypothetical protein [Salinispora sp. H7-4]|uniref:hypothetical protein n=1 Tax=Salinispora sp. H7-4 TaxID=2748321 RepID=UPI00210328DB|nr:hypothetical protein [Salinispora sp. H7-4]
MERPSWWVVDVDLYGFGVGGAGGSRWSGTPFSLILWEVLNGLYDDLGLDSLGDDAFGRWFWPGS